MNTFLFIITLLGGILILFSYFITFKNVSVEIINNPYWLGYDRTVIYIIIFFQSLATIGFFMFIIPWIFGKIPQKGILSNEVILCIVLLVFFVSSSLWAITAYNSLTNVSKISTVLCSISLIISAICSILFLIGALKDNPQRWYTILGTLLFAITTVFIDAIAWNSRFIKIYLDS